MHLEHSDKDLGKGCFGNPHLYNTKALLQATSKRNWSVTQEPPQCISDAWHKRTHLHNGSYVQRWGRRWRNNYQWLTMLNQQRVDVLTHKRIRRESIFIWYLWCFFSSLLTANGPQKGNMNCICSYHLKNYSLNSQLPPWYLKKKWHRREGKLIGLVCCLCCCHCCYSSTFYNVCPPSFKVHLAF